LSYQALGLEHQRLLAFGFCLLSVQPDINGINAHKITHFFIFSLSNKVVFQPLNEYFGFYRW
jgi:hypothetical protein